MKHFKYLVVVFALLLSLVLVGCGTGEGGGDKKPSKTVDELKTEVQAALEQYIIADHGSFKLVAVDGDKTSTIDMIFNYDNEKSGILSLKTVLTNASGTLSCYVEDDQAYVNRYEQAKNVLKMSSKEGEEIANNYCFEVFAESMIVMLNNSFFNALTIDSEENGVVKSTLGIGAYDISNEEESETLTTIFDGIKEKTSVTLEVTYAESVITNIKVVLVGDVTSSIELQLLGTSDSDIEIEFPDFSDYK